MLFGLLSGLRKTLTIWQAMKAEWKWQTVLNLIKTFSAAGVHKLRLECSVRRASRSLSARSKCWLQVLAASYRIRATQMIPLELPDSLKPVAWYESETIRSLLNRTLNQTLSRTLKFSVRLNGQVMLEARISIAFGRYERLLKAWQINETTVNDCQLDDKQSAIKSFVRRCHGQNCGRRL